MKNSNKICVSKKQIILGVSVICILFMVVFSIIANRKNILSTRASENVEHACGPLLACPIGWECTNKYIPMGYGYKICDKVQPAYSTTAHSTPDPSEVVWPLDAVLLFDQPNQRIGVNNIELYQNGTKSFQNDPFEVYVSPSAFEAYVNSLSAEGIIQGERVRFVYHFPGSPGGSETLCKNGLGNTIRLEMARAIYEHVYLPHYLGQNLNITDVAKMFLMESQNQENLVLWHEGQHIKHCRENWTNIQKAESDAIGAENKRAATLPPVFFLKYKQGVDLNAVVKYIEALRR